MSKNNPRNLLYTERGKKWYDQFELEDRDAAESIVGSLTLVSHSNFERNIQKLIEEEIKQNIGPIAMYATREVDTTKSFFEQFYDPTTKQINALASGTDHGSEARIAAIIRNVCKIDPVSLLNHPTIEEMRSKKCRTILLIDDFIGTGERTKQFIQSFWQSPTISSWHSLKYINFVVIAYSGTEKGIKRVEGHKAGAKIVIERSCPTIDEMPWSKKRKEKILEVCKKYGKKTSKGYWWDGYGGVKAVIVFEHGCPDNVPVILWAPSEPSKPWQPLFDNRSIQYAEMSVFPPEIARGDPVSTLLAVGQSRLAGSGALLRRGEWGSIILLVLALIAKGQRKQSTLGYATGLNKAECAKVIDKCIKLGFISQSRRITAKGKAELNAARKLKILKIDVPEVGEEYYYPRKLRKAARG